MPSMIKQSISQSAPVLSQAPTSNVPLAQNNQIPTNNPGGQLQPPAQTLAPQDISAYPTQISMPYMSYPYIPG